MGRTVGSIMCLVAVALFASVTSAQQNAKVIDKDTIWVGAVTVDAPVRVTKGTLTILPGSVVTFKAGGSISVQRDAALVAKGVPGAPVRMVGEKTGAITGHLAKVLLERCEIAGVASGNPKRPFFMNLSAGKDGVTLRDCKLTGCGGIWVTLGGPFVMSGCDVRESLQTVRLTGRGRAEVSGNALVGTNVSVGEHTVGVLRDNVVIRGTLSGWRTRMLLVEHNYVHQPKPKGSYGMRGTVGMIRNNVIRGGSWTTAGIGGTITANVLISLPHEGVKGPGDYDSQCTHEHICGLVPESKVFRNIFVGASYGGVMGIGPSTCSDSIIRNNTFDMRDRGTVICLNHLPKSDPKNIVIRANLFMRGTGILDERGIKDSTSSSDYTLWSSMGKRRGRGRYPKVTMTGKKPGDVDFGRHAVPPVGQDDKQPAPESVVVNPDVTFPFTDEDMLARKHTVVEVLAHYRKAYTPKPGSPAINAGGPVDKDDADVTDGKPDVGAVEYLAK